MIGIGMFSWFSYVLPIRERLQLIKSAGFDATSLWWEGEDKHTQPDIAREIGLQIDNIHTPVNEHNLLWLDGVDGEDYKNILISCVEDCRTHAIPTAVIHLTSFEGNTAVTDIGLTRIGEIIEIAQQKNVKLAFENLTALEHLTAVFERFTSPYIGFCYDSGHENYKHPSRDCLALYGNKLLALHINDNVGDGDIHMLPFDGTVDWNTKMQKLKQCKDVDYLTLEVGFCWNHEKCAVYRGLSAKEYLQLAHAKAVELLKL